MESKALNFKYQKGKSGIKARAGTAVVTLYYCTILYLGIVLVLRIVIGSVLFSSTLLAFFWHFTGVSDKALLNLSSLISLQHFAYLDISVKKSSSHVLIEENAKWITKFHKWPSNDVIFDIVFLSMIQEWLGHEKNLSRTNLNKCSVFQYGLSILRISKYSSPWS